MTDAQAPTYEVVHRAAQPAATVTRTVTMATIREAVDAIPPLFGWLAARGQAPSGPPFLRYLVVGSAAGAGDDLVVQAGVPVAVPVEADAHVEPDLLPAGDYLTTVHLGPYDGLPAATAALLEHAARAGLSVDKQPSEKGEAWAGRLEWYETNPVEEPDPARWATRLEVKLADG